MKTLIKRMLIISNRQDYFGKIVWINLAISILTIIFSIKNEFSLRCNAHLLIEVFISITTCGMFSIHGRNSSDFVFFISSYPKWKKFCVLLVSAIIQNFLFLLVLLVQLVFIFQAPIGVALLTAVLHFTYAIALGALVGTVIRSHTAGIVCLAIYYLTLFLDKQWPDMEMYRIFSPVLQLVNVGSIDASNTIALIGITLLSLSICYNTVRMSVRKMSWKANIIFTLGLLLIVSVVCKEYQYNSQLKNIDYKTLDVKQILVSYRGISKQEAETYGNWLSYIEAELIDENLVEEPIHQLVIQKYYISPSWIPYLNTPMIPVQIKEGIMYINIFSKAMMLHSNIEFRYDMLQRMTFHYLSTTDNGKHAGQLVLVYISDIIMNPDNVYTKEMKKYINRRGINFSKTNKEP